MAKSAPNCSLNNVALRMGDMELYEKEPTVTRAMALALMRQAQEYLLAIKEEEASSHLQRAVDTLLKTKTAGAA